ncbi:hypothetical protein [Ruminococcus sp.]|uniref:hypothetical protein n=1 Tax=Ruminococcus sp. TaxID=41978 RepID=UPI0025D4E7D7|nr:hypothetical protein [Ruminococcus sp.]MCR4640166.1 hypothetical protein [Ruminococcus sp.]
MKKIIISCIAIITMMLYIASPLFIKPIQANAATVQAEVGVPNETKGNRYITLEDILSYYGNDKMYYFVTGQDSYFYTDCLIFDDYESIDENYISGNYTYKYRIVRPTLNGGNAIIYTRRVDTSNQYDWKIRCSETEQTGNILIGANYKSFSGTGVTRTFGSDGSGLVSHEENFEPPTPSLDLSVSFAYPMSGTMTRQTIGDNGIPSSSDGNIMYVDNRRGDDAQFCMAIVPKGESLNFNTWIYTGRDNIIGDPTYVYMCDEWQSFGALSAINIGDSTASANSIYAACAWHAVPSGTNRTYGLVWESMDLQANKEYDVVVYACLNPDMEEMSGFYYDNYNLGGTYSVCGTLNDVQEVYRSTFSMTDPMKFNPEYKNPHDSSYAWNPNSSNSGLWENGSAYKDENGNIVIKGFKTGASTLSWENGGSGSGYLNGSTSGANINVNKAYGGFFGWFKGLLGLLPMEYNLLILFGFVGIVAIGLIKAVK